MISRSSIDKVIVIKGTKKALLYNETCYQQVSGKGPITDQRSMHSTIQQTGKIQISMRNDFYCIPIENFDIPTKNLFVTSQVASHILSICHLHFF